MKAKYIVLGLYIYLLSPFLYAQNGAVRKDSTKPYFYFGVDVDYRLRLKEVHDKGGKLQEKIFYRDRKGSKPTDTIEEKQAFKNGKMCDDIFYYNGKMNYAYKYNETGKKTENIEYEPGGGIKQKEVYTFGTDGSKKTEKYRGNGTIESISINDSSNEQLEWIKYDSSGRVHNKAISKYEGKQITQMDYDGDDVLHSKRVTDNTTRRHRGYYKYEELTIYYKSGKTKTVRVTDTTGNIIKYGEYEEDGSGRMMSFKTFPGKLKGPSGAQIMSGFQMVGNDRDGYKSEHTTGLPLEISTFAAGGTLTQKNVYQYDDKGNETEYEEYGADGKIGRKGKNAYQYDAKGNKTECTEYDADGNFVKKDVYKYDANGNMLEDIEYDVKGREKKRTTYTFTNN